MSPFRDSFIIIILSIKATPFPERAMGKKQDLSIELSAVIVSVRQSRPQVMVAAGPSLPSGPFETKHRTLEQGLRAWVLAQSEAKLGYVEQLYTFADKDRASGERRFVSIGYLALGRDAPEGPPTMDWYAFFPWEDHRAGPPTKIMALIQKRLNAWKNATADKEARKAREARIAVNFPKNPRDWNEELVLQRYELLWEAGLIEEKYRNTVTPATCRAEALPSCVESFIPFEPLNATAGRRGKAGVPFVSSPLIPSLSMSHDHRRILATGIARLRAKIKYRPVVFELLPERFTLLQLQETVEALAGLRLHKQNFRRLVQGQGLVEETKALTQTPRGRPAKLFAFRREILRDRAAAGTKLPRSG